MSYAIDGFLQMIDTLANTSSVKSYDETKSHTDFDPISQTDLVSKKIAPNQISPHSIKRLYQISSSSSEYNDSYEFDASNGDDEIPKFQPTNFNYQLHDILSNKNIIQNRTPYNTDVSHLPFHRYRPLDKDRHNARYQYTRRITNSQSKAIPANRIPVWDNRSIFNCNRYATNNSSSNPKHPEFRQLPNQNSFKWKTDSETKTPKPREMKDNILIYDSPTKPTPNARDRNAHYFNSKNAFSHRSRDQRKKETINPKKPHSKHKHIKHQHH